MSTSLPLSSLSPKVLLTDKVTREVHASGPNLLVKSHMVVWHPAYSGDEVSCYVVLKVVTRAVRGCKHIRICSCDIRKYGGRKNKTYITSQEMLPPSKIGISIAVARTA